MAGKNGLSDKQRKILDFISLYIGDTGRPPTIREIGEEVAISSTSVVNYNLNKLKEKGYLEREKEVSRGLRLTDKAQELYGNLVSAVEAAVGEIVDRYISVRLIGDIVASEPLEVGHDDFGTYDEEDTLAISANLIKGRPEELFALRVRGDSMIDAMINDGDIVIMKQATEARNGDMVAVWLDSSGTTTLKHFYNEGERVRLQPANPTMGPIYVDPSDVRVQGKVMMVLRQTA
jgi:repressor LexA